MYRRILVHYSLLTEAVPATETSRKWQWPQKEVPQH